MSTEMTYEFASSNLQDTMRLAEKIGRSLKGGEVIELQSDVGGGKTTFVSGIAKGIGSTDQVSSPTFTISKQYHAPDKGLEIHHFDFYRLDEPGLMKAELAESVMDDHTITIVEWAGIVAAVMPEDRLKIEITYTGEESRLFTITSSVGHEYLIERLSE